MVPSGNFHSALAIGPSDLIAKFKASPTALEASFKMDYISNIGSVIVGENNLCAEDALNLAIKSLGPITSADVILDAETPAASPLRKKDASRRAASITSRASPPRAALDRSLANDGTITVDITCFG